METGVDDAPSELSPVEPPSIWNDVPGTQRPPADEPVTFAQVLAYLRHPSPRTVLVLLFCFGNLFLILDQDKLAGWARVIAIWGTAIGGGLLTAALAYRLAQSRRARFRPILAKAFYSVWVAGCFVLLWNAVLDTRQAIDSSRWLELSTDLIPLPFAIDQGESYFTLDLRPTANGGLQQIATAGPNRMLWPEDRRPAKGTILWHGILASIRNRGFRSFSEIAFDSDVVYTQKNNPNGPPKTETTIRHVRIPGLAPGESIKILLATTREDVYVSVYKPRVVVARLGDKGQPREFHTVWIPEHGFIAQWKEWFLDGPMELPPLNAR